MQSTKLFRKYLEDTIESLQKSYDNYKQTEEAATDKDDALWINACAAQKLEALDEVKRALVAYDTFCEEKPEFHIISFNYYKTCASSLKVQYSKGDTITIEMEATKGLPSNEALDILLERAYKLAEQFNQVEEPFVAEA
jgi:hypothetical protein